MAITIANTQNIDDGGSYTIASGSNRVLVITGGWENDDAVTTLTVGGVAATQVVQSSSAYGRAAVWIIKEATIASNSLDSSAKTVSTGITWGGGGRLVCYTLKDVDQTASTVLDSYAASAYYDGSTTITRTMDPTEAGGASVLAFSSRYDGAWTQSTAWTEDYGNAGLGTQGVYCYSKANSGVTEAFTATRSSQANNFCAIAAVSFKPAAATTKKLKVLAHSSAAGATGVAGVVYSAPTASDITGSTKIGEFTGKSFESSLESNQAVLKVSCAAFGGSSLTTSDAPVALVRNTNNTTGIVSCTVIEE